MLCMHILKFPEVMYCMCVHIYTHTHLMLCMHILKFPEVVERVAAWLCV